MLTKFAHVLVGSRGKQGPNEPASIGQSPYRAATEEYSSTQVEGPTTVCNCTHKANERTRHEKNLNAHYCGSINLGRHLLHNHGWYCGEVPTCCSFRTINRGLALARLSAPHFSSNSIAIYASRSRMNSQNQPCHIVRKATIPKLTPYDHHAPARTDNPEEA